MSRSSVSLTTAFIVAVGGFVSIMSSSDISKKTISTDGYCEHVKGSRIFNMYDTAGLQEPTHRSKDLTSIPKGDTSFSTSKVFIGETFGNHSIRVVVNSDGTGECGIKNLPVSLYPDLLNDTLIYPLKTPS